MGLDLFVLFDWFGGLFSLFVGLLCVAWFGGVICFGV